MKKGVVNSIFFKALNPWGRKRDIISLLLQHSVPGALLDVAKRFEASKCDEDTLLSIRSQMENFVRQGVPSSPAAIYWLYGPAGVGKSAVAQSLALSLADESDLAASFFFSRTSSGQDDGDRLIVTLAYQLAMSFRGLRPFISESIKNASDLFAASNTVKMQRLVVDPINEWQSQYERSYFRRCTHTLLNPKRPYPRLILVDGLDECRDPLVQQDILHSIGRAVQQLKVPLRFVITSRPELHIMATFKFDPIFQGTHGISMAKLALGDDEQVVEQTIDFLFGQFAWIRGTHRLGRRLPQPWPHVNQIVQLAKTSLRFPTYSDTVTRYIAMPDHRPDECLEKLLALSNTGDDKTPYEPLDSLYHYIFRSIPDERKSDVRNILQFLIAPSNEMEVPIRITPVVLDKHFCYKRGRTLCVLRTLSCIVKFDGALDPIEVRHSSLSEFLLDSSRSGPLHIALPNVLTAIADIRPFVSKHFSSYTRPQPGSRFIEIDIPSLERIMQADVMPEINGFWNVVGVDFRRRCRQLLDTIDTLEDSTVYGYLASAEYVAAYLSVLVMKRVKHSEIRGIVSMIKPEITIHSKHPDSIYSYYAKLRSTALQTFFTWASSKFAQHRYIKHIFSEAMHHPSPLESELYDEIFDLYFSMVVPLFDIIRDSTQWEEQQIHLATTFLEANYTIETLMAFLSYRHDWEYSHIEYLCLLAVELLDEALRRDYSPTLITALDRASCIVSHGQYATKWLQKLAVVVTDYINRVSSSSPKQHMEELQRVNRAWTPYTVTEPLNITLHKRYDLAVENGNQLNIASAMAERCRGGR